MIMRACARLCVCVRACARTYASVWGLICFCVYVLVRSSSLIAVVLLQQDENKECVCLRGKQKGRERGREIQGGRESKSESERRDFGLVATSLFHVGRNRS